MQAIACLRNPIICSSVYCLRFMSAISHEMADFQTKDWHGWKGQITDTHPRTAFPSMIAAKLAPRAIAGYVDYLDQSIASNSEARRFALPGLTWEAQATRPLRWSRQFGSDSRFCDVGPCRTH